MRIRKPYGLVLAFALAVAGVSHAQSHPERLILGGGFPASANDTFNLPGIYLVNPSTGVLLTFNDFTVGSAYYMRDISVDFDNRSIVFGTGQGGASFVQNGLFRYSALTASYRTLVSDPVNLARVNGTQATQTGKWHITATNNSQIASGVYEVDPQGLYSTVLRANTNSMNLAIGRDVDSGNTIVPRTSGGVLEVSHNGTISTFASFNPRTGRDFDQRISDGAFYFVQSSSLVKFARTGGVQTVFNLPRAATGLAFDNQSLQNPLLQVYATNSNPRGADIWHLDPNSNFTITRTVPVVASGPNAKFPWGGGQALHYQDRYVQTALTAPRRYSLLLSFPTLPNKPYAVALTVSGIRPGFKVAGKRQVWLNPDALTTGSILGTLAPVFNPGPLVLSGTGSAFGTINLQSIARVPVTAHLVAAVIDPAAPDGFAFITEPYAFRLD